MPPKGSSKRKAEESEDVAESSENEQAPKAAKITTAVKKSTKKPTTLKDKILHLLENEDKLIGLPTIKKVLKEKYDVEDSKANITKINKILKDLSEEENHPRFGKIGNSYHGGPTSGGYLSYMKEQDAKEEEKAFNELHKHDIKCPHCERWIPCADALQGEDDDFYPRGHSFKCPHCYDYFYTWYTDGDVGPFEGRTESFRDAHPNDEGYN